MQQETGARIKEQRSGRVKWVDYAKGICIIFVVMLWCTLEYGYATGDGGWMDRVAAFARPFRMPDFFLLAGLFLGASIHSPALEYLDRKIVHFIYFYLLWLVIQMGIVDAGLLLSDPASFAGAFALALVEPLHTSLWFVHMLAVFYAVTRLLRHVPKWLVFVVAAGLQTAFVSGTLVTGWSVADRFFDRYVYFFAGYAAAVWVFAWARHVAGHQRLAVGALAVWGLVNGWVTSMGIDQTPGISLALGFTGAAAVVAIGSLLAERSWAGWLAYTGANSIVVYLTAFLPMKVFVKIFSLTGAIPDAGTAVLIASAGAVVTPLIFHRMIRHTALRFLYERPGVFRIVPARVRRPQMPAEAPIASGATARTAPLPAVDRLDSSP